MESNFIRERITALRIERNISEYQLSYLLGHSKRYINNISSGKSLPSLTELLAICDYFKITPSDFFNEHISHPFLAKEMLTYYNQLVYEDQKILLNLAKRLCK